MTTWTTLFNNTPANCSEGGFLAANPDWRAYSSGPDTYGANPTAYGGPSSDYNTSQWVHDGVVSVTSGVVQIRCYTDVSSGITYSAVIQHAFPGAGPTSFASGLTGYAYQYDARVITSGTGQDATDLQGIYVSDLRWPDSDNWVAEDDYYEGSVSGNWNGYHHYYNNVHTQDTYASGLPFTAGWVTLRDEWEPDGAGGGTLKWYVNGALVKTMTNGISQVPMRGPTFQVQSVPSGSGRPIPGGTCYVQVRNILVQTPVAATTQAQTSRVAFLAGPVAYTSRVAFLTSGATPPPTPTQGVAPKVEIEWTPGSGVWDDVTGDLISASIVRPRPDSTSPTASTTATVVLDNGPDATGFAPYTPESPAGANYPNVKPLRRVRITALYGTSSSVRFLGWASTWAPDASDGNVVSSTVELTAGDILGRFAATPILSDYGMAATLAFNNTGALTDYWPYDDGGDGSGAAPTTLRGIACDASVAPAQVIQPVSGTGSITFGAPSGGPLIDGAATFTRGDSSAPSPVILHQLRGGQQINRISCWVNLAQDVAGANDDILNLRAADGSTVWRLVAAVTGTGTIEWQVLDSTDTLRTWWDTGAPRDEAWHWLSVLCVSSTVINLAIRDQSIPDRVVAGTLGSYTADPRFGQYLVVGGHMNALLPRKQTNTLQGSVGGVYVDYVGKPSISQLANAGEVYTADQRVITLAEYGFNLGLLVGGAAYATGDQTPVQLTNASRDLLSAWSEHCLTTGGALTSTPAGKARYVPPANARPTTPAIVFDAAADLDMPTGGWSQTLPSNPTRVTSSSPAGSTTLIDADTEAETGVVSSTSISTAAGDIATAANAAARVMAVDVSRLSSFGYDPTVAATDQRAALMGLLQGDRIRVAGLPPGFQGVTYKDVYASGWTETYVAEGERCGFVFDTDPADAPPEAHFDDAEFGRFGMDDGSTITGGTCLGTTATGTVVVTTGTDIDSTAVPFDIDWHGERCTVTAASGGSGTWTLTLGARGVAPSVARIHTVGEPVDIWHAMCFGL